MRGKMIPASRGSADGETPSKAQDDSDFKARWIPFGMALKKKADGYGIDWRSMSMENFFKTLTTIEGWHQEDQCGM